MLGNDPSLVYQAYVDEIQADRFWDDRIVVRKQLFVRQGHEDGTDISSIRTDSVHDMGHSVSLTDLLSLALMTACKMC